MQIEYYQAPYLAHYMIMNLLLKLIHEEFISTIKLHLTNLRLCETQANFKTSRYFLIV